MILRTLSITLIIMFSYLGLYGQIPQRDVVYLKNGSIIKGIIIEQIPNQTIKIQTADGSIFVYDMIDIVRIVKEPYESKKGFKSSENRDFLKNEFEISRLSSRKNFDLLGLITVYGLTIVGDFAVAGGLDFPVLFIPVVGPFIAMGQPEAEDVDVIAFAISGGIQLFFELDYFKTSRKINKIKRQLSINIVPDNSLRSIEIAYNF